MALVLCGVPTSIRVMVEASRKDGNIMKRSGIEKPAAKAPLRIIVVWSTSVVFLFFSMVLSSAVLALAHWPYLCSGNQYLFARH